MPVDNVFPGLRPFREGEEHLFFGRERQIDAMVDKLGATNFLAVVGTSGSGKSSLVNCGLRPALRLGLLASAGTSWRMAKCRPGGDPFRAMAVELARKGVLFDDVDHGVVPLDEIIETNLRAGKLGLIDVYDQARLADDVNLLVVVDQFEEIFRYQKLRGSRRATAADGVSFVNLLLEPRAARHERIFVVLTMRSDFLGDCAQFPGLPDAINDGQFLVPRMSRADRRAAIQGPLAVGQADISPVLLTRLVNDVGDDPDQLSILQHALSRTWDQWTGEGRHGPLTLQHYTAVGTMATALDRHAEEAYAALTGERERRVCEKVFKALTDRGTDARGVRRPTRMATLCELADADHDEVAKVVDVFRSSSRSFLMPPVPEALEPDTVIDISHESLMRVWVRLRDWAAEEAESAATYRRLLQTAQLHGEGKASLLSGAELATAKAWRDRERPTEAWSDQYAGVVGQEDDTGGDRVRPGDRHRNEDVSRMSTSFDDVIAFLRRSGRVVGVRRAAVIATMAIVLVMMAAFGYSTNRALELQVAADAAQVAAFQARIERDQERVLTDSLQAQFDSLETYLDVVVQGAFQANVAARDSLRRFVDELFAVAPTARDSSVLATVERMLGEPETALRNGSAGSVDLNSLRIENNRLLGDGVTYSRSPNQSNDFTPQFALIHYTASTSLEGAVQWALSPAAKNSSHLMIGRDGRIVQLVDFDQRAWHAGRSEWDGRSGLNGFAVGIDLVNAGSLQGGPGSWRDWRGALIEDSEVDVASFPGLDGAQGRQSYTEAQISALTVVLRALDQRYGLDDVLGHFDVSPGRKLDPGPLLPMERIRREILGSRYVPR